MSRPLPDLVGKRFGMLVVIAREPTARGGSKWRCVCDCGNFSTHLHSNLASNHTRSCGCKNGRYKHGHATVGETSKTFSIWASMIQRCSNPNSKDYHKYGGRGIVVCREWADFATFLGDMGEKPTGLSLDRIDNNSGYSKSNCRWATPAEQSRNQRKSKRWIVDGKSYSSLTECAKALNLEKHATLRRFSRNTPGYTKENLYE